MKKINIANILKNCPEGTKLYSPLCGECTFVAINAVGTIICKRPNGQDITFTQEGIMRFWVAREMLGNLYLYDTEPYLDGEEWNSTGNYYLIDKHLFSEVTFKNSPQQVEIKLVKEK